MKLAIATLTFNCLNLTQKLINSINESNIDIPFSFIWVDNGSTDGTVEYFNGKLTHKKCYGFHSIINVKNKGCASGWNSGIEKAWELGADYCIEVNNDIEFNPYAIQNLYNAAEKYTDFGVITAVDAKENYLNAELKDEVEWGLCWSCFLIKKSIWKKFGGFDERIWPVKSEDYLAHGKMIKENIKCMAIKTAYVNHLGDGTGKGNPDKKINWAAHLAKNMEYVDKMNFEMTEEEKDKIAPPKEYINLE